MTPAEHDALVQKVTVLAIDVGILKSIPPKIDSVSDSVNELVTAFTSFRAEQKQRCDQHLSTTQAVVDNLWKGTPTQRPLRDIIQDNTRDIKAMDEKIDREVGEINDRLDGDEKHLSYDEVQRVAATVRSRNHWWSYAVLPGSMIAAVTVLVGGLVAWVIPSSVERAVIQQMSGKGSRMQVSTETTETSKVSTAAFMPPSPSPKAAP